MQFAVRVSCVVRMAVAMRSIPHNVRSAGLARVSSALPLPSVRSISHNTTAHIRGFAPAWC